MKIATSGVARTRTRWGFRFGASAEVGGCFFAGVFIIASSG